MKNELPTCHDAKQALHIRGLMTSILCILAMAGSASAQDDRDLWPVGSARHTLFVEVEREQALRSALDAAHARLLGAFGDTPDDPAPLAQAVANQQQAWLAYRGSDCQLAGMLTGAGGAWPHVHALTCSNAVLAQRTAVIDAAATCLQRLPAERYPSDEEACLRPLVEGSTGEP
ncbi:lysozyme inhibitor LprI family protein [Luteimonas viscosa]|nr:lysozyme inhibitor LprI family protein [Luteimonas viscosa]